MPCDINLVSSAFYFFCYCENSEEIVEGQDWDHKAHHNASSARCSLQNSLVASDTVALAIWPLIIQVGFEVSFRLSFRGMGGDTRGAGDALAPPLFEEGGGG